MKVEVAVLGSPSLTVLMVSACGYKASLNFNSALLVIVGVFGDQNLAVIYCSRRRCLGDFSVP